LDTARVCAERFVRKLRGGSQPVLVEASDGLLYVLKFRNNLQGANLAFNESIGAQIYKAFALPVPTWKPLVLSTDFVDRTPACWMETMDGRLRPEPGLCFASRFLGQRGARLFEILPGTSFRHLVNRNCFWLAWVVDICCEHTDNRQALFVNGPEGRLRTWFIDMGHLFGGAGGAPQKRHFSRSRYLDPRVYAKIGSEEMAGFYRMMRSLDVDGLWRASRNLPRDWISATAMQMFFCSLDTLANADLCFEILHVLVDTQSKEDNPFVSPLAGVRADIAAAPEMCSVCTPAESLG